MADHGTLLSAPMVLASLVGRKTETRRLAWRPDGRPSQWQRVAKGDRLWIRETHALVGSVDPPWVIYRANGYDEECKRHGFDEPYLPESFITWRPSIFLERSRSRLTYVDLEPRMERLQDITAEGAIAEGLACVSKDQARTWKYGIPDRDGCPGTEDFGWPWHEWCVDPIEAYAKLWTKLHGRGAWESNPEVVVLPAGDVIKANIDQIGERDG